MEAIAGGAACRSGWWNEEALALLRIPPLLRLLTLLCDFKRSAGVRGGVYWNLAGWLSIGFCGAVLARARGGVAAAAHAVGQQEPSLRCERQDVPDVVPRDDPTLQRKRSAAVSDTQQGQRER